MAVDVAVYRKRGRGRSEVVCAAMYQGIASCGERVRLLDEETYSEPDAQVAVFYGLAGNLQGIFADYRHAGRTAVYVDLGYWGRSQGGKLAGYHKISVNDRHPTRYFQNRRHSNDRVRMFRLEIEKWHSGTAVLVAGMGAKSAEVEGIDPESWERAAIKQIQKFTDRRIIYRPKPSWREARPIGGTIYSTRHESLCTVLDQCHAVVTHHSNVAIDGLLAGVPAFCWNGVAKPMSKQNLASIHEPLYPEGREQWAADIAYCQWSVSEMSMGMPWRHLKDEGLVP
jgi:hypothetical protein